MKIRRVHVEDFRSLRDFTWDGLDPHLNIIVGPNGAGKSTLFEAIRAVGNLVDSGMPRSERATSLRPFRVDLDVELTSPWEQETLRAFMAGALSSTERVTTNRVAQVELSRRLLATLQISDIDYLFAGRLSVTYQGEGEWRAHYESLPGARSFYLPVRGEHRSTLFSARPGVRVPMTIQEWHQHLHGSMDQDLTEWLNNPERELPHFDVNVLAFLEQRGAGLHGIPLTLRHAPLSPAHQEFARLTGLRLEPSQQFPVELIFGLLLRHALVFTENVRRFPRLAVTTSELTAPWLDLSSGEMLALDLFCKKNGKREDRESYDAIEASFARLTGHSFDVGLRSEPTGSHRETSSDAGEIRLALNLVGPTEDYPLVASGAGRAEALHLAALVAGESGRVLLLDEPAANLHPTTQTVLLAELRRHEANQCLVVTHSPALVPAEALGTVSRFFVEAGATQRAALDLAAFDAQQRATLEKELRGSTDARGLLFARGVILVEGGTELGALPVWYQDHTGRGFHADDIAMYGVGSDTSFGTFVAFLHRFRVPWAIVCDGSIIGNAASTKYPRCRIANQLAKAGISDISTSLDEEDFHSRQQALEHFGVFTLATAAEGKGEGFEGLAVVQDHLEEAEAEVGRNSKPRKGRYIAEHYPCPQEVAGVLRRVLAHLGVAH